MNLNDYVIIMITHCSLIVRNVVPLFKLIMCSDEVNEIRNRNDL